MPLSYWKGLQEGWPHWVIGILKCRCALGSRHPLFTPFSSCCSCAQDFSRITYRGVSRLCIWVAIAKYDQGEYPHVTEEQLRTCRQGLDVFLGYEFLKPQLKLPFSPAISPASEASLWGRAGKAAVACSFPPQEQYK